MKKALISLLMLSLIVSCNDNSSDDLGDSLLDRIDFIPTEALNYRIEYSYEWDTKNRLSYIYYKNTWIDSFGWMEISYIDDFMISASYNNGNYDSYGTYTIFHDGIMVDSVHYTGGTYTLGSFEQTSHFTHFEHMIMEVRTTSREYSEETVVDTSTWNINQNGQIESINMDTGLEYGQPRKEFFEFKYDNKRNPFANSFIHFARIGRRKIYPILTHNNIISYRESSGYYLYIDYNYLKNDLPKFSKIISPNGTNTYEYIY